jgi:hypothetical protein
VCNVFELPPPPSPPVAAAACAATQRTPTARARRGRSRRRVRIRAAGCETAPPDAAQPSISMYGVEIMGAQKCGIVGGSQPALMMIYPIIFTRTRSADSAPPRLAAVLGGRMGRPSHRAPRTRRCEANAVPAQQRLRVRASRVFGAPILIARIWRRPIRRTVPCRRLRRSSSTLWRSGGGSTSRGPTTCRSRSSLFSCRYIGANPHHLTLASADDRSDPHGRAPSGHRICHRICHHLTLTIR